MPSWSTLVSQFNGIPPEAKADWLTQSQNHALATISKLRDDRHVVVYGSAFLQKPQVPAPWLSITHEDLNGLMAVIHGMTWSRGLTLILHTPGGVTNATESVVDYLRTKFNEVEVIVPAFAMSAGSMISLAADQIMMGRQSQLGPIDPQMNIGSMSVSARAVVEQFDRAKLEILADLNTAHVWAPILSSLGPSLLQEAQNALDYSEQMVAKWVSAYMFRGEADAQKKGEAIARHFNDASTHKSHGRRIGRDEARAQGVKVTDLEDSQDLQDAVLTAYHLMTIGFENTLLSKVMLSNTGQGWAKNFATPDQMKALQEAQQGGSAPVQTPPP